jgi:hypothetical protein
MKPEFCFLLLIACLLSAACESAKIENSAPNANAPANAQTAANNSANDSADQTNSNENVNPNASSKSVKEDDFAGTAGITDKKYDIKSTAVLKEIRAAAHENFDRVVFEFEGAEMPPYHIEYIDKPVRACGSGDVVPLKGDGWLEIRFNNAAAHTESGEPTVKDRAQSPNLKIIKEMKLTCDFEAEVEWVLGVASPNKYRVLELKNPTRLAVDIKHKR